MLYDYTLFKWASAYPYQPYGTVTVLEDQGLIEGLVTSFEKDYNIQFYVFEGRLEITDRDYRPHPLTTYIVAQLLLRFRGDEVAPLTEKLLEIPLPPLSNLFPEHAWLVPIMYNLTPKKVTKNSSLVEGPLYIWTFKVDNKKWSVKVGANTIMVQTPTDHYEAAYMLRALRQHIARGWHGP